MKKNLPLIIVGAGLVVVLLAVFIVFKTLKGSVTNRTDSEEENIPELSQELWPAVTLTPVTDASIPNSLGHLLKLRVQKISVSGADSLDYLLVYTTSAGGQQGVPGTIKLTGGDVDKDLLLGSESSGKYRFDDGVSQGTITLTFRNTEGKSLGKVESMFHFQKDAATLTSVDGNFSYTLDKTTKGVYFITMPTLKEPEKTDNLVTWSNGYGIFSSDAKPHTGK